MMSSKRLTHEVVQDIEGQEIYIQTGELAGLADGSVVVKSGKAVLLATVVERVEEESLGFLPLSVDYQEKFYAAGKIPGGFLKRESKSSEQEVLIARLVDRALRPCFPKNYHNSVQITLWLLSADENIAADTLATLAASTALMLSPVPFQGPVSGLRVARIQGKIQINPLVPTHPQADIDLMLAAKLDSIVMIEGKMNEVEKKDLLEVLEYGHQAIKKQCELQKELAVKVGVEKNIDEAITEESLVDGSFIKAFYQPCYKITQQGIKSKKERDRAFEQVKKNYIINLPEGKEISNELINQSFYKVQKKAVTDFLIKENQRIDGRKPDEIRDIHGFVDYIPSPHGSALFTRGETQSLTTLTLGGKQDEQLIDGVTDNKSKKIILHYNFPGFSTGEVKPVRGPARREIGHANLALNGIKPVLPKDYPFTIRIVSEILESNGSSSMATACCASLALADAGVPIKTHVAGIAMGRISSEHTDSKEKKHTILSDISGTEDFFGDMDFKLLGTKNGLTACQLDVKIQNLTIRQIEQIVDQAIQGIKHILVKMNQIIDVPRNTLKPHTPKIHTLKIASSTIGALIGPSGKVIKDIQQTTGVTIDIAEKNNHAIVTIFAPNEQSGKQAFQRVKQITAVPTLGDTYLGKVKSVQDFGIFVEFLPAKDGLLHISEISEEHVHSIHELFKIGQEIKVKLIKIHARTGKYGLSSKGL